MISKSKAVLNSTKPAGSFRSPGALTADSRALDTRTREAPGATEAEGRLRSCPGPSRFNAAWTISLPHSGQSTILGNADNPGSHCPADNLAYNNAAWRKTSLQERAREKELVKIKCSHFRNQVDAIWMIPVQVVPPPSSPSSAPGAGAQFHLGGPSSPASAKWPSWETRKPETHPSRKRTAPLAPAPTPTRPARLPRRQRGGRFPGPA